MNLETSSPQESSTSKMDEPCDVSVKFVGGAAVALIVIVAAALFGLTGFLGRMERSAKRQDNFSSSPDPRQTPPKPRLQSDPPQELAAFREKEDHTLTHYEWVDRSKQVVRIPIDRAIHLLAERGIPEPAGPLELPPTTEVKR